MPEPAYYLERILEKVKLREKYDICTVIALMTFTRQLLEQHKLKHDQSFSLISFSSSSAIFTSCTSSWFIRAVDKYKVKKIIMSLVIGKGS